MIDIVLKSEVLGILEVHKSWQQAASHGDPSLPPVSRHLSGVARDDGSQAYARELGRFVLKCKTFQHKSPIKCLSEGQDSTSSGDSILNTILEIVIYSRLVFGSNSMEW